MLYGPVSPFLGDATNQTPPSVPQISHSTEMQQSGEHLATYCDQSLSQLACPASPAARPRFPLPTRLPGVGEDDVGALQCPSLSRPTIQFSLSNRPAYCRPSCRALHLPSFSVLRLLDKMPAQVPICLPALSDLVCLRSGDRPGAW